MNIELNPVEQTRKQRAALSAYQVSVRLICVASVVPNVSLCTHPSSPSMKPTWVCGLFAAWGKLAYVCLCANIDYLSSPQANSPHAVNSQQDILLSPLWEYPGLLLLLYSPQLTPADKKKPSLLESHTKIGGKSRAIPKEGSILGTLFSILF